MSYPLFMMRLGLSLFCYFYLSFCVLFCVPWAFCISIEEDSRDSHPKYSLQAISPYQAVSKGKSFLMAIDISLFEDWYTYWSFPGDYGLPTKVQILDSDGAVLKALALPRPERKGLSFNDKMSYSFVYQEELLIPFEVFIPNDYQGSFLNLQFSLEWGLCKEICIFLQNTVDFTIKISDSFVPDPQQKKKFAFWESRFPVDPQTLNLKAEFWDKGQDKRILSFSFDREISCLDLFPQSESDFLSSIPYILSQNSQSCVLEVERSSFRETKSSVFSPESLAKKTQETDPQKNLQESPHGISGLLIFSQNQDIQSLVWTAHRKKKPL